MAVIKLQTYVNAPVQVCFNLSRNIDLHLHTMQKKKEQAVAGVTAGLINLHETVTWKTNHFGMPVKMMVKITEMQIPHFFVVEQVKGPFKWIRHYHGFQESNGGTLMVDEFAFCSRLGWLGKLVDKLFLKNYMQKLVQQRNQELKQYAEKQSLN